MIGTIYVGTIGTIRGWRRFRPIPSPDTRSDLAKPVVYWTPIIAPGSLMFYNGAMFRSRRVQR